MSFASRTAPLAILASLTVACSTVNARQDFDPEMDFSPWRTYAWYPEPTTTGDPRLDNPLLRDRVESAVERALAAAGYTPPQDRAPDFYVNFHLSTQRRLDTRTLNRGYSGAAGGRRTRGASGGVAWTETRVEEYEVGTLVIDFVEASERRLVWRGSGTRRLSSNPTPERTTKRVDEAVAEILSQFPPQ